MRRHLAIYRTILDTFGFTLRPVGTYGALQVRNGLHAVTRGLDHVLAPGFKRVPIDRPVFLLGNPRSGTTFVHRFLLHTEQLAAFELWEMLFPAVTARRLLGGLVGHMAPFNPAQYHSSDAHETSLRDVETDDALAFLQFLDGPFAWAYFDAWHDTFGSPACRAKFDPALESPRDKERLYRYLEASWRRNLYAKQRPRVVAKSSLFSLRAPELVERYPDCKLVYLVRDPLATIPSGMSLITGVLEQAYDLFERVPADRLAPYLENLYQAGCHIYRGFYDDWSNGRIPAENLRVVTYPRLMTRLEDVMEELVDFLELEPPPSFGDRVREQAEVQRRRQSPHAYSLEKFNLTPERIRKDLAFVYDTWEVA